MQYKDGTPVKVGDHVKLPGNITGIVSCSIDTDEYTAEYARNDWEYLENGIMVNTEELGLIHFREKDGVLEKT